MLNVVIINGGRGAAALIPQLLDRQGLSVTSVVNAYDDGKSTGEIRRYFGMLGPSDIRKVQELMLPPGKSDHAEHLHLFQYRYPDDVCHDDVMVEIEAFAAGSSDELGGVSITSPLVRSSLRRYLKSFTESLKLIEIVRGVPFSFSDCSIMNIIYAGAFLSHDRNIEKAAVNIGQLFKLRGTVLPTSIENKQLVAIRENGEVLFTEADIVELRSNVLIDRIYLLDTPLAPEAFDPLSVEQKRDYLHRHHCYVGVSPSVELALRQADVIIYSAGTQHSSLYPTYLSFGLAKTIADNRDALKVFVTNIGADYETPSYKASDYLRGAFRYLNLSDSRDYDLSELFDAALISDSRNKREDTYVEYDEAGFADLPVRRILGDFESSASPGKHDGVTTVQTIMELYDERALND